MYSIYYIIIIIIIIIIRYVYYSPQLPRLRHGALQPPAKVSAAGTATRPPSAHGVGRPL